MTHYIPGGNADERPWARLVANATSSELIESARSHEVDFRQLLQMVPSAIPPLNYSWLETAPIEDGLATNVGVTAVFTGDGGDAVLGRHGTELAPAEYLLKHGPTPSFLRVVTDTALVTNTSVWGVLSDAIRYAWSGAWNTRKHELFEDRNLVTPDTLQDVFRETTHFPHPWFRDINIGRWSVINQLTHWTQPAWFYDPLNQPDRQRFELVQPLLSQPVVELCIRIPGHVLITGRRDRGLARQAFAEDLPAEIKLRQWKDRIPGFSARLLFFNAKFARELLLDGFLVRERVLDRVRLEDALSSSPIRLRYFAPQIFDYIYTEIWLQRLRAWQTRSFECKPAVDIT